MKILLGCNRFFEEVRGGGNRVAWDVARHLVGHGHEVALLCEGLPGRPEREVVQGVTVLRYQVSRFDFNFVNRHQRAGRKLLQRQLADWRPDLIWGHMPLQTAAILAMFPSTPVSYTVHSPSGLEVLQSGFDGDPIRKCRSALITWIEHKCCRRAEVITVLSEFTKSEVLRLHGQDLAARIHISPGWADLERFRPATDKTACKRGLQWPTDKTVFLCVRRLVDRMGLDRLVEAAGIVRDRGLAFHLYLVGKGPLQEKLESIIASLRLSDHVSLMGGVSEEELAAMYAAGDAFVIPTRALECFGLIAVESMAAGTPVLSTPVGALPEIIGRIEPQWLTRDNSSQAIADRMTDFIEGRLPQHSAGELRRFVEANYDRKEALERFVRIGTSVLTAKATV